MAQSPHKADADAVKFDEVYKKEWQEIRGRRSQQLYINTPDTNSGENSPPESLVGLALSGGGIRSATFCLGFLQGLQRLKLLRLFDYLSTVSGGGYVGGWWSAWLTRERTIPHTDEDQNPHALARFRRKDIKNPCKLAIKLNECDDNVTKTLRETFSSKTNNLLKQYKKDGVLSDVLVDSMVEELSQAIESKEFYKRTKEENNGHSRSNAEPLSDAHYIWSNRLLIEKTYSSEIKGIFPPGEQIEPERARDEIKEAMGKESESSKNAWKDPLHHLRLYANYLTPRRGLLSADTWRAVSTIARNLALNWLIMLPLLMAVMLLGQLYFLLHPRTSDKFFQTSVGNASDIFIAMIPPLAAILGWIVVTTIAWLFFNRDNSKISDKIIHVACLMAVGVLLLSGLRVFTPFSIVGLLESFIGTKSLFWAVFAWALVAIVMLFSVCGQSYVVAAETDDPETKGRWKSEVQRNKISRLHSWLLVLLIMVAAVLFLSGFSHIFLSDLSGYRLPLGILPILTIASSIFTAFKATPSGGGDKKEAREPSKLTRLIFAVTPGLVIIVLAVTVSWLGHNLLQSIWNNKNIDSLLTVAAIYGITLFGALALYEMNLPTKPNPIPVSITLVFGGLLIVNLSWGSTALIKYFYPKIKDQQYGEDPTVIWFLLVSIVVGVIAALVISINRFALKEKVREAIRNNRLLNKIQRGRAVLIWSICLGILLALIVFGVMLSFERGVYYVVNPTVLPLALAALAGSLIPFRLSVVMRREDKDRPFELRLFKGKAIGKSPAALWILVAVCLAFPIAISSWMHAILEQSGSQYNTRDILQLIFFPLIIALLPISIFFVWKKTIQAKEHSEANKSRIEEGKTKGKGHGVLSRFIRKIPEDSPKRKTALRVMAAIGVVVALFAGYIIRKFTERPPRLIESMGLPINLMIIIIIYAGVVALFKAAVFEFPVVAPSKRPKKSGKGSVVSKAPGHLFIWLLAGTSIALAVWVGFLTKVWADHIKEFPINDTLASVALPGMAACFMFTLFEMLWGKGENRRSTWLIALTYLGLSMLFIVGWASANGPWWDAFFSTNWEPIIKPLKIIFGLLAVALVWVIALGWMIDPNTVSMHQFYKARLVRAYLGASNPRRLMENKEVTEAVAGDDVPLKDLKNCEKGAPYHLINTTLNLAAGRDLATAQRSAASFVLSKNHCGSLRTCYRPTDLYMNGRLSLGTAVAASGAAVSPSMGSKKPTAALAMLLTLLNVRLGYWSPTPNKDNWGKSQPRLWPFYLLREFLSQTNDLSSYCYLTDGGHFDNTGLYTLVERGCRLIVLVDCAADPQPSCFQDLGEAIRRCRIDFGAEIDLQLDPLVENNKKAATRYFTVGKIVYSKKHAGILHFKRKANGKDDEEYRTGIIIYFKPLMLGKETADVRQYALENKHFPQQSTANQWFGEAQFESYRRLGESYAEKAFDGLKSVEQIKEKIRLSPKDAETIFQEVQSRFHLEGNLQKKVRTNRTSRAGRNRL